jgi:hypothetical protein
MKIMKKTSVSIKARIASIATCLIIVSGIQTASAAPHYLGERWGGGIIVWMSDQTAAGTGGATGASYLMMDTVNNPTLMNWAAGMSWASGIDNGWHVPAGYTAGTELWKLWKFFKCSGCPNNNLHPGGKYWSSYVPSVGFAVRGNFLPLYGTNSTSKATPLLVRLVRTGTF